MSERIFVKTTELVPGLKLEQEVMNDYGMILIARGTVLDEHMIESISRIGLPGVYTEKMETMELPAEAAEIEDSIPLVGDQLRPMIPEPSPTVDKTIHLLSVQDRAKLELSEMVKKRAAESIAYMFGNTDAPDFSEKTMGVAGDLMRAILENDAIAVDIGVLKICDEYTFKHSVDVAAISMIIGRQYGLGNHEVYELGIAGLLHDIGKSKIPNEILQKPGKLTEEEFSNVKRHAYFGYDIIRNKQEFNEKIKLAVLEHHEKLDKSGYPLRMEPAKISLYARILSIADIYDALVTDRPYKKAYSKRDAIEIIMSMTGELDIAVMQAFLHSVILYPVGSNIYLSNGEWARVVENDPNFLLRPKCVGIISGKVYDLSKDVNCANIIVQD